MSASFRQAMEIAGLLPGEIIDDGRWRRCKTADKSSRRNGAYILHPDGRGYWRNWALDDGVNAWKDDSATQAKPIDQARIRAQREKERAYRIQSVRSARQFWNAARPLSLHHPYLDGKGLSPVGSAGLRGHDGLLVVPVMLGAVLISVQTIAVDGAKRFWPGAPVKAGSFTLARPRAAITVLCEGLATGLAVYQSMRNATVIVCFDAGNLIQVADYVRPTGAVVVMADNDWKTNLKIGKNPGIEAAKNAADLIGAGVAWCDGIEGSDAADFLKEVGDGAPKKLERLILGKMKFVVKS